MARQAVCKRTVLTEGVLAPPFDDETCGSRARDEPFRSMFPFTVWGSRLGQRLLKRGRCSLLCLRYPSLRFILRLFRHAAGRLCAPRPRSECRRQVGDTSCPRALCSRKNIVLAVGCSACSQTPWLWRPPQGNSARAVASKCASFRDSVPTCILRLLPIIPATGLVMLGYGPRSGHRGGQVKTITVLEGDMAPHLWQWPLAGAQFG